MAGYKLGQKVLLSNGSLKNIEDVQIGDQLFSFDIPEITVGVDFTTLESLTLNTQNVLYPEVSEVIQESGNYLQINGLGVIDEYVLGYHKLEQRYQFIPTMSLVVGGDYDMVRMVDGEIIHEPVVSKDIVYSTDPIYNITLGGPNYYILDGYIVHNVGYACIRDCSTGSKYACIQNVYGFGIGDVFKDNIGACWQVINIGGCAEACPMANISFIGTVVSSHVSCEECYGGDRPVDPVPYEPGLEPNSWDYMGLGEDCCAYLIPCDTIDPGLCGCAYAYAFQYVNLTISPCPNAGQVVKLNSCDDCCYFIEAIIPDCEAVATCTATAYETCTECCGDVPVTPTPTGTPAVTPTRTPTRTPTVTPSNTANWCYYNAEDCCGNLPDITVRIPCSVTVNQDAGVIYNNNCYYITGNSSALKTLRFLV